MLSVVQLVDKEGTPYGERKVTVSGDIVYLNGDDATENGFSASEAGIAMVALGATAEELLPLVGAAASTSWIPIWGWIVIAIIVVVTIVIVAVVIYNQLTKVDPKPVSNFNCTPTSGIAPSIINCTDQ